MKQLESHFDNSSSSDAVPNQSSAPSDIVPGIYYLVFIYLVVTGLILGKLHRIENELKTVLLHWNPGSRRTSVRK